MKKLAYVLIFISINTFAQGKYLTKTGTLNFEASVPSFEEVAAKNNSVTAILNTANNEFAALALVKGFRFKNALMEEHFNENYAESDEYPKAIFKGKVTDNTIKGELTFHGVSKHLDDIPITITKKDDHIIMSGSFMVKASDFDIKIPKIVKSKVAEDIKVSFEFQLEKK